MDLKIRQTVSSALRERGAALSEAASVEAELEQLIGLVLGCSARPWADPGRVHSALRLRYGIGSGDSPPLADVAKALGVSKQRVHQLERRFLARLEGAAEFIRTPRLDECAAHYRATPGVPFPRLGRCSQRRACELSARMRSRAR